LFAIDFDGSHHMLGERSVAARTGDRARGSPRRALRQWNVLGYQNPRLIDFVKRFKAAGASMTPTLHVFAQRYGLTWFTSPARDLNEDPSHFSKADLARAIAGYKVMASYVKRLHDAGIPMTDVFRIATLETAMGIGHGSEYGAIEPGRRADLILFDGDPLGRPRDLLGTKTVIKDGVVCP